jgi:hypothetical protein
MSKPLSSGRSPEEIIAQFSQEYSDYCAIHEPELSRPTSPSRLPRLKRLTTVRIGRRKRPMPPHEKF